MTEQSPSVVRRALLKIEELQAKLDAVQAAEAEPIALVGYGCRLPGNIHTPTALWQFLCDGGDAIGEIPADRWDIDSVFDPEPGVPGKMYTRRGGFLGNVDRFDASFFGISPREAARLDPQQRLLLEVSWEALEQGGIAPLSLRGSSTGVYIGQATNDYAQLHVKSGDATSLDTYFATGTAASVASGRLSYTLGLHGPALTLDTACSSSLVALHLACQALRRRECDLALVGGVNLILSSEAVIAMCQSRMMSADGTCKTFDAGADGFGQAEGCVVIVIKRLSDAQRDGDTILALVQGSAVNQDGSSSGLTAPSGPAQTAVIRAAFRDAKISPQDCAYVEAHGTGTSLGDPIEIQAMAAAFGPDRDAAQKLLTGSIKTNLGHLEAAAGLTGLLKVVLSLQHGQIPPHLHLHNPNPLIPWDRIPVQVVDRLIPFLQINGRRVAGLSSFGFSGTNAHIVLEEAPRRPTADLGPTSKKPLELLTLSGKGSPALRDAVSAVKALLEQNPHLDLADLASSANTGRSPSTDRLAVVAANAVEAKQKLASFLAGESVRGVMSGALETADPPRIAFLFSGQGSQYLGMGRRLYEDHPVFRAAFNECDVSFQKYLPDSIVDVVYGSSDSAALSNTQWTQPALFAIEWALARLWRSWGVEPGLVLGHSIGEYVAACLSGVFSLDDATRLVAARATLMGSLPGGAMTAVMASEAEVDFVLASLPELSLAAVNGASTVTISGPTPVVDEAEQRLAARGILFMRLDVSHAFHSSMLDPVLDEFESVANGIDMSEPAITLISNVSGQAARKGAISNGRYWRQQTRGTVRFSGGLRAAYGLGYRVFIELGPKSSLTSLATRAFGDDCLCLAVLKDAQDPWLTTLEALGQLYLKGAAIDWKSFHSSHSARRITLPTYPFQRSRFWLEPPQIRASVSRAHVAEATGSGHPHLSRRTDTALGEAIFEIDLDPEKHPYLTEHKVNGSIILPTAFYLDLVASAVAEVGKSSRVILEDVLIHQAVEIPADGRKLQILMNSPTLPGEFRVFSEEDGQWVAVVSGSFVSRLEDARPLRNGGTRTDSIAALQPVEIEQFYAAFDRIGLQFGSTFHRLATLKRRDGEAEADVAALEGGRFNIHPAVLDGCLQVLAAALPGFDPKSFETDVYMPIGIDRFELFTAARGQVRGLASLNLDADDGQALAKPETRVGSVSIEGADGELIAQITGVRMKRAGARQKPAAAGTEHLYEVEWRPTDLARSTTEASALAGFDATKLDAVLTADFRRLSQEYGLSDQVKLEPDLDAVCTSFLLEALADFGWHGKPGSVLDIVDLTKQIEPRHHRLANRIVAILADDGLIERRFTDPAGQWRVLRDMTARSNISVASLIARFPQFRPEITFAQRGGLGLSAALRGRIDATDVLFPGGSFELADELYRRSPAANVFNRLASKAAAEAIAACPHDRPIRILEIGGGTGGVTSAILPAIPPGRATYLFTDISPVFIHKAGEDFAAYPFVRFECLDIERSPAEQGFEQHSFDLIVASNVLHATDDMSRTLNHVRSLLAPGGHVLILEGLKPVRWIDLSFGLTEGWWKFSDADLRPDYPLMPADSWRELLMSKGFSNPVVTPAAIHHEAVGQGLIVAQLGLAALSPATDKTGSSHLVFADKSGVADPLIDRLRAQGAAPNVVRSGNAFVAKGSSFEINPLEPEQHHRIFAALADQGRMPSTIVYLWPIDADIRPDASLSQFREQMELCCSGLLSLVHAYAANAKGRPLALWIVTRSAQSVLPTDRLEGVVQSTLLGLAKVAALELPEVACYRVDLERLDDVEALAEELNDPSGEPMVAFRDGRRYIARLSPATLSDSTRGEGRELYIAERGSVDGLALRSVERPTLGKYDVEIKVAASGLNFRDVLNVLGARDDDAPFGGEVSGLITRVGDRVEGLAVGQAVVSVTFGGHGDFARAPAELTLPKPANLDWAEAAASTLAFLTAHFALSIIGDMKPGERVLIHAAAGGVGIAAVQLAQRAGLEIFATAGSEAKRAVLKGMGVKHVYDSRTLDFAREIMRDSDGAGIDLVLSAVTGPAIAAGLKLLRANGRYLEIGKSELLSDAEACAINGHARYYALDLADMIVNDPARVRPMFVDIMSRLSSSALEPLPSQTFALAEASAAFEHLARARHVGKVVLLVNDPTDSSGALDDGLPLTLGMHATYLISGGLSGLGLASAERLVERGARHLVLFGRRPPSYAHDRTIQAMRARGAAITVLQADVSSETEMKALFDDVLRDLPPLRGVIHSAGQLEDGVLTQQSWQRFADVLAPKAFGGWILHQLCADKALDFFVLYSSASALLGAPGQSNHAAANSFLDGLAGYRRGLGLPGLSINWGAWGEIGAAAGKHTLSRLEERGVAPLSVQQGLAALERVLQQPKSQVGVIRADWGRVTNLLESHVERRFLELLVAADAAPTPSPNAGAEAGFGDIRNAPVSKRRELLNTLVTEQVAAVLGVPKSKPIPGNQPFRDMGLDSLMALELRTKLKKALHLATALPATLAFDHPTINALMNHLMQDVLGWETQAKAAAETSSDRTAIDEIEQMSDDEIDRILNLRRAGAK